MAQENCWRGWLRINARHQELHRPWQHLRKQQPNDRRLQTVNHWTITHGHVIRRKCRPKLYNLILWYLFSYTCFFLWRKEEILSILFFHQCLYIHLILKTDIPFSWHAGDATMVCTSKLCWCIEWYDMHFHFYVEDTKLHTCNKKYYKKSIVSRSLIHCIYIHVYVYLYDIMLRIFANSMCTWLLYETFLIPFMIEVTDAFFWKPFNNNWHIHCSMKFMYPIHVS